MNGHLGRAFRLGSSLGRRVQKTFPCGSKFTTFADQLAHGTPNSDEYELESDTAGTAWPLIGRMSF
jgi:hypothetical protein